MNEESLKDKIIKDIEDLSGYSMSDVRIHYNTSNPRQLDPKAYSEGQQINIEHGNPKHLTHEAWHIVQQKTGRIRFINKIKSRKNRAIRNRKFPLKYFTFR